MKKGDIFWLLTLGLISFILIFKPTHEIFIESTTNHPYIMGFIKVSILATMGELLAIRITSDKWIKPAGLILRAIIWGFLGMVFAIVFPIFGGGVASAMSKGLLPGSGSKFLFAFFTSTFMNLIFAPTMMAFHRFTDTYIDLKYGLNKNNVSIKEIVNTINWDKFISFVVIKTIPCFWIPAHTITFLLPEAYRVLLAAFLSIALGAILAFSSKRNTTQI